MVILSIAIEIILLCDMLHHSGLEYERNFGSQTSIEYGCCNYDKDYDTTASSSD
jgi:hypothetical protein